MKKEGRIFPKVLFSDSSSVNEDLPLLSPQKSNRKLKITIAGVSCCVLTTATVSLTVYFSTLKKGSSPSTIDNGEISNLTHPNTTTGTPKLSFYFDVPQQGTGNLILNNIGNVDVEVHSIQFSTNAIITGVQGNLAPGGSHLEANATGGMWINYKLVEPAKPVVLAVNSTKNFVYSYQQAKGIFNIGVLPKGIIVNTPKSSYTPPLANQCINNTCYDPFPGKIVGGYYTQDAFQRQFTVNQINPSSLNHIYYAPISCDPTGDMLITDYSVASTQLPILMRLRAQYPYMKVSFSIGAKTDTDSFHAIIKNAAARELFCNNAVQMLEQFGFTGIDINFNSPRQDEANNFVAFYQALRNRLDLSGQKYELSLIGSASADKINAICTRWTKVPVDFINLPAYGFSASYSDYQSPLYLPPQDPNGQTNSLDGALNLYAHCLFPKEKIVLGITAQYSGVNVVSLNNEGFWQKINGTPAGQFADPGLFDLSCVKGQCYGGNHFPANCIYFDEKNSWFGNFSHTPMFKCTNPPTIFTGESQISVIYKTQYMLYQNLKGVFVSPLASDTRDSNSLLKTVGNVITPPHESHQNNHSLVSIQSEAEWNNFVQNLKANISETFLNGALYTLMFLLIDKITDKLMDKLLPKKNGMLIDNAYYYSVKATVYLVALYFVGIPLLPAVAGKLLGMSINHLLQLKGKQSMLAGNLSSFSTNLVATPDLHSLEGIVLAAGSFLVSAAGSFSVFSVGEIVNDLKTSTASLYETGKKWCGYLPTFGFFKMAANIENLNTPSLEEARPIYKS